MRKTVYLLCALFLAFANSAGAQQFKFDKNGEFKILHLTDIHYIHGLDKSKAAIDCIHKVIDAERPDLVVVTGDMIFGKPGKESISDVIAAISSHGIPFCTTFGNHDDEQGLTRAELYDIISANPLCVNPDRGDSPSPDYVVPVYSRDGKKKSAVLYCLDSNAYSPIADVKGYNWFSYDQIGWYRQQSRQLTKENSGTPLPALAFFHIPLPEYAQAIADPSTPVFGTRKESGGQPKVNSGMFINMKECGDVMGVFAGHDHDDDYALSYYGICLAYGRFSGCSNVYNHLSNGGRVIILRENERRFDSYIRLRSGEVIQPFTFPDDFILTKETYKAE